MGCSTDDETARKKGQEKEINKDQGHEYKSDENEQGRGHEIDPFRRRSSLARSPPTSRPGTSEYKSGPVENNLVERTECHTGEEHRDRDKEKRKRHGDGRAENRRLRVQLEGMVEGTRSEPATPSAGALDLSWEETSMRSVKKKKEEHGYKSQEVMSEALAMRPN